MTSNPNSTGREDEYMNNNNDTQHSNMQEQIVNRIPASCEQEENPKQVPLHRNIDEPDESTNTQTCYERVSRKADINIPLICSPSIYSWVVHIHKITISCT